MGYRLTPFGHSRLPLPGVKWGDMTDKEFADAKRRHPGIEDQGLFEHVDEKAEAELTAEPRSARSKPAEDSKEEAPKEGEVNA